MVSETGQMKSFSVERVVEVMKRNDHTVFDNPDQPWNLNIVGIRSKNIEPELFDDLMVVFYRRDKDWIEDRFTITTDPSIYYLRNPINKKGTAILREGQYKDAYRIGRHKGRQALRQVGLLTVYRDKNLDNFLNMEKIPTETGDYFAINIHRGPYLKIENPKNHKYSAGCQVFAYPKEFKRFMEICKQADGGQKRKFTYTLLKEAYFDQA